MSRILFDISSKHIVNFTESFIIEITLKSLYTPPPSCEDFENQIYFNLPMKCEKVVKTDSSTNSYLAECRLIGVRLVGFEISQSDMELTLTTDGALIYNIDGVYK